MSLLLETIPGLVSGNAGAKPHFLALWGQLLKKYDFLHTVTFDKCSHSGSRLSF